jgi:SAM-dependent methyltransferase
MNPNPTSAQSLPPRTPVTLANPRPVDWEALWAPYDEGTYRTALDLLQPNDVVLDIGAGDLRFARRAALRVRKVIAVERNRSVLMARSAAEEPTNLMVVCGDALALPIPEGITTAVLLMRHCRHFKEHLLRLRAAGCRRLITNARWGMDVECVPLEPQLPYWSAPSGWYACACGTVGFKIPAGGEVPATALDSTVSVEDCPACLAPRVVPTPASRRRP